MATEDNSTAHPSSFYSIHMIFITHGTPKQYDSRPHTPLQRRQKLLILQRILPYPIRAAPGMTLSLLLLAFHIHYPPVSITAQKQNPQTPNIAKRVTYHEA
jgi:hypothetical protein